MKDFIAKMSFNEKEKAIANSLIALFSGVVVKNDIAILCSDCKMLVSVYKRIQDDIDKLKGESKNRFYYEWKYLMNIPLTRLSIIIELINILLKFPKINEKDRNIAQRAYGIIEEYELGNMIHRIAKILNKEKPFKMIISNG